MTEDELIQKTEEICNLLGTKNLIKIKEWIDDNPIIMEKNPSLHGYTVLESACLNNNVEIVKLLIENKINTQIVGTLNHPPLSVAAMKNNIEILRYLCSLNIYNMSMINKALEDAIFFNRCDCIDYLIEMGGDINHDDCTTLRLICSMEKYEAIEYMVSLNCIIPEDLISHDKKMEDMMNYYRNNQKLNQQLNQTLPKKRAKKEFPKI